MEDGKALKQAAPATDTRALAQRLSSVEEKLASLSKSFEEIDERVASLEDAEAPKSGISCGCVHLAPRDVFLGVLALFAALAGVAIHHGPEVKAVSWLHSCSASASERVPGVRTLGIGEFRVAQLRALPAPRR